MTSTGEKYPVNLDEVWPLVYAEKGKSTRALRKEFIEGVDFQSFSQNGKREIGGTVTHAYFLSVSCLEYFIARKVRAVFEVYREVFHKVADELEQKAVEAPALPKTYREALAELLAEVEAREKAEQELALAQPKLEIIPS